jgi:hypothetical protein
MESLLGRCPEDPVAVAWLWAAASLIALYPTVVSIRMIRRRCWVWSRDGKHALEGRRAAALGWTVLLLMTLSLAVALHDWACALYVR